MALIRLVIGVRLNRLIVHSAFSIGSLYDIIVASDMIDYSSGKKALLISLGNQHGKKIATLAEEKDRQGDHLAWRIFDKTPLKIFNGYAVIAHTSPHIHGFEHVPPKQNIPTAIGDSLPLDGDDLYWLLKGFRKGLNS